MDNQQYLDEILKAIKDLTEKFDRLFPWANPPLNPPPYKPWHQPEPWPALGCCEACRASGVCMCVRPDRNITW